jgi:hypothetical protein
MILATKNQWDRTENPETSPSRYFLTKAPKIYTGEKIASLTSSAWKIGYLYLED